ncbi:hypothetical protein TELCIR_04019 [Teladorsagia circumcincta]|uniref:Uncharacterized protein n=1 Tax=Teladorsagia circumcincta TaxID=45464 RepID=A0A2G9UUZ7_TELCI|nr:hypothetical protein TELCIR_04019 [Teladorsagia circumcincta]
MADNDQGKFNSNKQNKDRQEEGRHHQMGDAADSKLNDSENAVDNCADKAGALKDDSKRMPDSHGMP